MAENLPLAVALNGYGATRVEGERITREILAWNDLIGLARLAERLGFEAILTPEIGGREAFSTLASFAVATDRIRIGTGVVRLDRRDLGTLAMAAASLQEQSRGRFVLGVGSMYPVERTRAILRGLRGAVEGLGILDEGDGGVAVETDWRDQAAPTAVWLAALGPRMTRLAAEEADGVLLNWCTPERVAEARAVAGDRRGFTVAVYVRGSLGGPDEDGIRALVLEAERYARMPPYRRQLEAMGLDPTDAESVVRAVCVLGDRAAVLGRLAEYRDAGADLVVVYPVATADAVTSLTGTLMTVAPDPSLEGAGRPEDASG